VGRHVTEELGGIARGIAPGLPVWEGSGGDDNDAERAICLALCSLLVAAAAALISPPGGRASTGRQHAAVGISENVAPAPAFGRRSHQCFRSERSRTRRLRS